MRLTNVRPRVLVVEDSDPDFLGLEAQLKSLGVDIRIDQAKTLREARQKVQENCHHFALVGLHIDEVEQPDGPGVVKEIHDIWPENLHDCVAIYTDRDIDGFAELKQAFGGRFIRKDRVEETVDWLTRQVRDKQAGGYNWDLVIEFDESARTIDPNLVPDIEDTLRQLFRSKGTLSVSKLAEQGYSGAVLLQATQAADASFEPRRFVLKFGPIDAVEKEHKAVEDYVLRSSLDCAPHMESIAYNRTKTRGAIKFHTVATSETLEAKLDRVSSDDSLRECKRYLRRVIDAMTQSWYKYGGWADPPTASELIADDFEGYARDNLAQIFRQIDNSPSPDGTTRIRLGRLTLNLRDPNANVPPSLGTSERVPLRIAHNDFHTKNILISNKSENVYLIDYARTRDRMHAYADFAKMETHLLSDMLFPRIYEQRLPEFFELLRQLYTPVAFTQVDSHFEALAADRFQSLACRNCVAMIRETRQGWLNLLDQIDSGRAQSAPRQWKHYVYALLLELYQSLWWVKTMSKERCVAVLYFISLLLDLNAGTAVTSASTGGRRR